MPQIFKCASCSGPLEFIGGKTQKCSFCGSTVLVPPYLFADDDPGMRVDIPAQRELDDLTQKALIFAEIKKLIADGKKIHAIKLYHEKFGVGLGDAKDAIDKLERGEPVAFTRLSLTSSPSPGRDITVNATAAKLAGGFFITFTLAVAILLFVIAVIAFFVMQNSSTKNEPATAVEQSDPKGGSGAAELLRIGGEGTGVGRFTDNRVVAVDNAGNIYSTDYKGGRVQVFDGAGNFVRQWATIDSDLVFAIGADRSGHLFVLGNKGIVKHDAADGTEKARHADPRLRDIHITPEGSVIAVGRQGIIYLDKDLKVTKTFREASSDAGSSFGFESVTADAAGTMFMLDRRSNDVIKFSAEGKFLNRIAVEVNSPNDIALDPSGNIYLSDTSKIVVLSPNGKHIAEMKANQAFGIAFNDAGEMFVASRPFVVKQRPSL